MVNRLKSIDEIFGEESLDEEKQDKDKIVHLDIDRLVDYRKGNIGKNRYSDADMNDLVESIKNNGVLQPATVRPIEEGMYEIVLGHHRKDASILAGKNTLPCMIREMDDNTAELMFMESNIQKGFEKLSHSEKAELIYRRNEALKAQWKRTDLMSEEEKESISSASDEFNLSASTIKRYLRIYQLSDEIKLLLDNENIGIRVAVNLSYIPLDAQIKIHNVVKEHKVSLSEDDSLELRENAKLGNLTESFIEKLLLRGDVRHNIIKKKTKSYKIKPTTFLKYFSNDQDEDEIDKIIDKALSEYFTT